MNSYLRDFVQTTQELLDSRQVRMMGQWRHHGRITCLDHSLFVAYISFRCARLLHLDSAAAARAGLLHDLYLYDPKDKSAHPGNQCFDHPRAAERNASALTRLTPKERYIIVCAGLEFSHLYHPGRLRRQLGVVPLQAAA